MHAAIPCCGMMNAVNKHVLMKQSFVLLFLLLGLCNSAVGQILPFRTYSIEHGLSESVVNDLVQDQNGYLWIATSYGLNRFDGIDFTNYYTDDGLRDNRIMALYEDHNNRLWIGTESGDNVVHTEGMHTPQVRTP